MEGYTNDLSQPKREPTTASLTQETGPITAASPHQHASLAQTTACSEMPRLFARELTTISPDTLTQKVVSKTALLTAEFFEECQALIYRFMHKPVPGETCQPGQVARPVHGAMHLCRAAMWVPVLLSLRKEMGDRDAIALSPEDLPFVMKAALLHDSGRKVEGVDQAQWERVSAEQCEDHLLAIGCRPELAAKCRQGIINKDGNNKSLIARLIHDADCLEIMRVPEGNHFDIKELDLFQEFKNQQNTPELLYRLSSQVRAFIARQGDLWGNTQIINSESGYQFKEDKENICQENYSETDKESFEFADNAFIHQLASLQTEAPELYQLYNRSIAPTPVDVKINPLTMINISESKGWSAGSSFNGLYQDQETGLKYYIKEPRKADSARNEVLMARLAGILGLKAPNVRLIKKEGRTFVVSPWQEGLKQDETALSQSNPDQLAKLYLVSSVLGNADVIGYTFDNSLLNQQGEPVAVGWGEAGEFGAPNANERKIDYFGSTVFELDTLKTAEDPLGKRTDSERVVISNAASIFQPLSEEVIVKAARELLSRDVSEVSQLIEILGPDAPADRQQLQRVVHERLAYVARRYPTACAERITPVEQATLNACGVDGYSIPVSSQDIANADLRLYQCYDQQNQPVTECWLKLNPEAARRFASEKLGLPPRYHHQLGEIRTYAAALQTAPAMSGQWRAQLEHVIGLCRSVSMELKLQSDRLSGSDATVDVPAVVQTLTNLGDHCNLLLQTVKDGQPLSPMPDLKLPSIVHEGLPSRVTSIDFERPEKMLFSERHLRYDRAWEQGESQELIDVGQPCRIRARSFLPEALGKVEIEWFSDDLPEALTLEGGLRLRIPEQGQSASQKLLDALILMGIDVSRPDNSTVQGQYIDTLIDAYCLSPEMPETITALQDINERHKRKVEWLLPKLELEREPRWEKNHRIEAGRLVFLRPEGPLELDPEDKEYLPIHELDFFNSAYRENVLEKMLHSGRHLSAITDRLRMGVDCKNPASLYEDLQRGGGNSVFLRIVHKTHLPRYGLILKPEVLRRADLYAYARDLRGDRRPAMVRLNRKCPVHDTWQLLTREPFNDISLPSALSLGQVEGVRLPMEKRRAMGAELEARIASWPDGRLRDQVVDTECNPDFYKECFARLTGTESPLSANAKACVMQLGEEHIPDLLENNPELLNGKLASLYNVKRAGFGPIEFHGIDFSDIELPVSERKWIEFTDCKIKDVDFKKMNFFIMRFVDCQFENVSFCASDFSYSFQIKYSDPDSPQCRDMRDLCYDFCRNNYKHPFAMFQAMGNTGLFESVFYQHDIDALCVEAVENLFSLYKGWNMHDHELQRCLEVACRVRKNNPNDKKILSVMDLSQAETKFQKFLSNNNQFLQDKSGEKIAFRDVHFKKRADFRGIDLEGYSFAGAHFDQAIFAPGQLDAVDTTGTNFKNCRTIPVDYSRIS